jgi:hypothetical protein
VSISSTNKMSDITPYDSASNINTTASSTTVPSTTNINKRPQSVVWEVCEDDKTKAFCSLCKKKFAYSNYGAKNLKSHLNSQHSAIVNAAERDSKQPRIDDMLKNPVAIFSQDLFEDRLIKWIVKKMISHFMKWNL